MRLTARPEPGCGGRFVEMVIICRIDLAIARAAGTHKLTHAHMHTRTHKLATLTDSHTQRNTVAWQKQTP